LREYNLEEKEIDMTSPTRFTAIRAALLLAFGISAAAADMPGSQDPPGMKRYEGSELIGYRPPKFDEFLLPLGRPTGFSPVAYEKSLKTEGLVSRYTYLAPAGRTPAELLRNYKLEFTRLGLVTMYEKAAGEKGWFGPTFDRIADEDQLGQMLAYNENQERVLVAKTKDSKPAYYFVFVTSYMNGVLPNRLSGKVTADRAVAEVVVVTPEKLEEKMVFVNAAEMAKSLADAGKVALYGIHFDTDKDVVRPDSQPALAEIAKLLAANPQMKLHVVGHTDNQGKPDYNLDLSRRRAANVVQELTTKNGVAANRLDAFGAGLYAPIASNATEEGRAQNRRVELVLW
jgi:outer membrane protein OmpA-like peptidoglycan-associated protein